MRLGPRVPCVPWPPPRVLCTCKHVLWLCLCTVPMLVQALVPVQVLVLALLI